MTTRKLVTTPLAGLALALIGYAVYSHVAAYRARRPPDVASFVVDVGSPGALAQTFTVDARGGAAYQRSDGNLAISSAAAPPGGPAPVLRLMRSEERLGDVRLRARFRRRDLGSGVFVGLVTDDGAGGKPRELRFTIHDDGLAEIAGDATDSGRRQRIVCSAPRPVEGAVPGSAQADVWHELALRVSPALSTALGSVDGRPVASCAIGWSTGTPVRSFFGALGSTNHPIAVDLTELAGETIPSGDAAESFVDRFDGKVVDPLRWAVLLPDPWLAHTETRSLANGEGGLWVSAASAHATDLVSGLTLVTRRMPLGSFTFAARVRPKDLHAAAIFVGVGTTDSALVARRSLEAGLLDAGDGKIAPFVTGHWTGSGQRSFQSLGLLEPSSGAPAAQAPDKARRIEVSFDAATGIGRVALDGATLFERPVELRPLEDVTFRIGVNLHEAGALAEFVLEEARLELR